jgi:pimeloyl-ACP methyl ester carboxylesterase
MLVVPETRGKRNGRFVSLAVAIVRARVPGKRSDPVIYLHGGPGGSAVPHLPRVFEEGGMQELVGTDRDWIFFDQRGGGLSTPLLSCGVVALSDAGLRDQAAVDAMRACAARHEAAGVDLAQFNIAATVRDMEDLRKALGIGSYNLYGLSYGTRVAMGVLARNPKDLRAVVLDSPLPPEADITAPVPNLVSRETRKVLAICAADAECARRFPNLERRLDEMLGSWLAASPVIDGKTYQPEDIAAFLLGSLYGYESARSLPANLDRILAGKLAPLDAYLKAEEGYAEAQFYTHTCREYYGFESPAAVDLAAADPIARATARAVRRHFAACAGFNLGALDPVDHAPVSSAVPTLFLAAGIDAGCPAELSKAAVRRMSKGQLAVFPNTTHSIAFHSKCARELITRFLNAPDSKLDSSCIADSTQRFELMLDPVER